MIKLEGRKILLCQPFEQKTATPSKEESQNDISELNTDIEVGVDLGLIHFGVLSVRDKSKPIYCDEVKRYFLNQRALFDMIFNAETGAFEYITYTNTFMNKKAETIENTVNTQKTVVVINLVIQPNGS